MPSGGMGWDRGGSAWEGREGLGARALKVEGVARVRPLKDAEAHEVVRRERTVVVAAAARTRPQLAEVRHRRAEQAGKERALPRVLALAVADEAGVRV